MHKLSDEKFCNLIFIPATCGRERITAMFDTGASLSVITKSLAEKLNCKPSRQVSAGNNNGANLKIDCGILENIEFGGITVKNISCGIVPNAYFDFGKDENGNCFPAKMLLGWDIISLFHWKIDLINKTYSVSDGTTDHRDNTLFYEKFPIINLNFRSETVALGFDTGHTSTMLDYSWKDKFNEALPAETETVGVGSVSKEKVSIIPCVEFEFKNEKITITNVEIFGHGIFSSKKSSISGLLGMDFFENSRLEIDYKRNYFNIERRKY